MNQHERPRVVGLRLLFHGMTWAAVCCLALSTSCDNARRNRFHDATLRKIHELQDRRRTDSLIMYASNADPEYRTAAAVALGSVQDSASVSTLGLLLLDPAPEVRLEAAFSLGQIGSREALKELTQALSGSNPDVAIEMLEAIGKCATKPHVPNELVTAIDSSLMSGQAWGLYRAGLLGVLDTVGTRKAVDLINTRDGDAVLPAANYFSRVAFPVTPEVLPALKSRAAHPEAEVRMALPNALRKTNDPGALEVITSLINDPDYRVRANVARGLRFYPWSQSSASLRQLLADSNVVVGIAAAEAILLMPSTQNQEELVSLARDAKEGRTKAHLFQAALKVRESKEIIDEVSTLYAAAVDEPYQRSWLLQSLSASQAAIQFVADQLNPAMPLVVRSSAAATLVSIDRSAALTPAQRLKLASIYQSAIKDGDVGVINYVCAALRDPALGYPNIITDRTFLREARERLSLPKDYETILPLDQTIAYFEGRVEPTVPHNTYNHPIDWKLILSLPHDQKVAITTSKGRILMQLLVDEAPGSVANFVQLANRGYFNEKFFHRVVPNFVIQTGCNRGDGFGSEDYSIRSEFTRRKYKTGSVGMASAGKDTEGTQWFITHSPTPHLDGKYTIFAEVVEGMDVVHKINVGDRIISVEVLPK